MGCDLCESEFWVGGWRWVDFNRCVDGLVLFIYFLLGVDGRLWVAGGGGVRCV